LLIDVSNQWFIFIDYKGIGEKNQTKANGNINSIIKYRTMEFYDRRCLE